jgi:hypothetical protein
MNHALYRAAGIVGLLVIGWVAAGYLQTHALALVMTLLIGAFYAMGALELHRFQRDTGALDRALAGLATTPASLANWLAQLPASLRDSVRLRVEGERAALPGPALTPYLAGLLVLLGMLGTFLGMVVTLQGTGLALERATDVQTMRDSLAAPVRGLGLAFGTSVAGVAASAMLGLMAALARRARLQVAQRLDAHIAGVLQPFTRAHRQQVLRNEALALQQQQAQQLATLMAQMEQHTRATGEALLASQQRFQAHTEESFRALAASVDRTLQRSLIESARTAAATIEPAVLATMSGITRETAALHGHIAGAVQQQLDGLAQRFEAQSTRWLDAVGTQAQQQQATLLQELAAAQARQQAEQATLVVQLREQLSRSLANDNTLLEERSRTLATMDTLLGAVQHTTTEQQAAIDRMVQSTAAWLEQAGARYTERAEADAVRLESAAAQLSAGAIDVASLGEAFGGAVEQFGHSSAQLLAQLQQVEAALARASSRSDEQLAYVVAQAREVIDLSLLSQKQIVDDLQRLARRPAAVASEA